MSAILKHEGKDYTQGGQNNEKWMWVPGSSVEKSHYTRLWEEPGFKKQWESVVKSDVLTWSHQMWGLPLVSHILAHFHAYPGPQPTSDLLWKLVLRWKFPLQIQKTLSESALKFLMLLAPTFFDKIHVNKAHLRKNMSSHLPSLSLVQQRNWLRGLQIKGLQRSL